MPNRLVAPDVRFVFEWPLGASEDAEGALPSFELGPLHGARVVLRRGASGGFGVARVACAVAPSRGWAPGVEDLVLGRATQIAHGALSEIANLDTSPPISTPFGFEQTFEGHARDGAIVGKHWLVFTEAGESALLCTALCASNEAAACTPFVNEARISGELAAPPPPSLFVRAIFAAAEHPTRAAITIAIVYVAITALLFFRREASRHDA